VSPIRAENSDSCHRLTRKCFHGQRGRTPAEVPGQEDQLGPLRLVLNALILRNTRYIYAALNHIRGPCVKKQIHHLSYLRARRTGLGFFNGKCCKPEIPDARNGSSWRSRNSGEPKEPGNKRDLPRDIVLRQPSHLSLADHVRRLKTLNRSHRTIK